ncbi:hypothetical protein ACQP2K_34645 [Microbispora siamensis]
MTEIEDAARFLGVPAATPDVTIAEFLGHADPGFTLRTYTHLMLSSEDLMRAAIESARAKGTADGSSALDMP